MVSRRQKLLAAGVVLGVGLAAAMLFRRGDETPRTAVATAVPAKSVTSETPSSLAVSLEGQFSPQPPVAATTVSSVESVEPSPALPAASPNIAPMIAAEAAPIVPLPEETTVGRPVYVVENPAEAGSPDTESGYRVHVIHNGDTLERLAERYLADGSRALELFDLNRDVLQNPHLLPLGVELRIPVGALTDAAAE